MIEQFIVKLVSYGWVHLEKVWFLMVICAYTKKVFRSAYKGIPRLSKVNLSIKKVTLMCTK